MASSADPLNRCHLLSDQTSSAWHALGHTPNQVLHRLQHMLESSGISDAVQQWFSDDMSNLDAIVQHTSPESTELLDRYYQTFNAIFFGNLLLPHRCRWIFLPFSHPEWQQTLLGWVDQPRRFPATYNPSSVFAAIRITERDHGRHPVGRLGSYIGTLLHEMLHAFITIHSCFCNTCRASATWSRGTTGHGLIWLRLADLFENFSSRTLALNIDVGIRNSFAVEFLRRPLDPDGVRNYLRAPGLNPETVRWIIRVFAQNGVRVGLRPCEMGNRPRVGIRELTAVQEFEEKYGWRKRSGSWTDAASNSGAIYDC